MNSSENQGSYKGKKIDGAICSKSNKKCLDSNEDFAQRGPKQLQKHGMNVGESFYGS